jgi:hypothetical protein
MMGLPKEIQDQLDQEKAVTDALNKKLAMARSHPFTPRQNPDDPTGVRCAVEGCGLTAMAHTPAAEA